MKIKASFGQRVFDVINFLFILLIAIVTVYPIWYVFCASFSDNAAITAHSGLLLLPVKFTPAAYNMVFKNEMILRGYTNTIFIVCAGTLINLVMTLLGAYVLSRKNVYWNKLFNLIIIITMFFSGGLIPTYLLITKTLNLNNSYLALLLPNAINVFNLIMARTNFEAIPISLEEAAKLDGASHFRIFCSIILPVSKAIIAVLTLYYAVGHWNAWFEASIYIKERAKYPLQLILQEILINNNTSDMSGNAVAAADQMDIGETIKYAVIVVATLPVLCIFPFLQKYFAQGVMIGAVKG